MLIKPAIFKLLNEQRAYLTPDDIAEVLDLLQAREKIQAIKLIRQETSLGLKEAKDIADALEQIIQQD